LFDPQKVFEQYLRILVPERFGLPGTFDIKKAEAFLSQFTRPQQAVLLKMIEDAKAQLRGKDQSHIPEDPASFAEKYSALYGGSEGKLSVWRRARHLDKVNELLVDLTTGKKRRVIVAMPVRHGKALSHDTPMLCKDGWKTHGELKPGDQIYGLSGKLTTVVATGPEIEIDKEVCFSNGASLKAHSQHEWLVYDRGRGKERVIETGYLEQRKLFSGGRCVIQLPDKKALEGEEANLPIAPYFLGVWLGDGTSASPTICYAEADSKVVEHAIASSGEVASWNTTHKITGVKYQGFTGLIQKFKQLDLVNNKHIPEIYKNASIKQRLDLLAGLVDTDGHVERSTGRVRIATVSDRLRDDILDLARSFGWEPYCYTQVPCTSSSGIVGRRPVHYVGFQPTLDIPTILHRKQIKRFAKKWRVGIKEVKTIAPVLGRCIQVSAEDGVYLAGRELIPTHNSELITFWNSLWRLARVPSTKIGLFGYSHDFIRTRAGKPLRDYVRDYGDKLGISLDPTSSSAQSWNTSEGGYVHTAGRGGSAAGKTFDLIVIDDPYKNYEEAISETVRESVWNWWTTAIWSRKQPQTSFLIVQTLWHMDDLASKIIKQSQSGEGPEWEVVKLPAIAEENDILGRQPGEALWPEGIPLEELLITKQGTPPHQWSALYQQNPIPSEGNMFPMDWWQYYEVLPAQMDVMVQSWDFSFKDAKKSDFVVGQVWGRKGATFYLVDQIRARMSAKESIEAIRAFTGKYPQARAKLFEDKANGPALKALLNHEVGGIIPLNPKGNKETRAAAIQPYVQAGNVFLPSPKICPWVNDFIIELGQFPNGSNDDQVDAASQALMYLAPQGWASMNQAYGLARAEDEARHQNPQKALQDAVWKAMKQEVRKTQKEQEKNRRGSGGRSWNF
jgi:predicted phage terminase large subunit-like protein